MVAAAVVSSPPRVAADLRPYSPPTVAVPPYNSTRNMSDEEHKSARRLPQLRLHYDTPSGDGKRESDDGGSESDSQSLRTPPLAAQERKRPRYLSDIDRSIIIQRLEKGEKQADLAREFRVTRAAICHINKNKREVLTRFDEFARSPHGRLLIENYSRPSTEFESVIEVRTTAATVLMTRMKDKTTLPQSYRASADRLIKLLIEEALVSFGSASMAADSSDALTLETIPCGIALGREGTVMVDIFKDMEPDAETGSIFSAERYSESSMTNWQVMTVDLPASIATSIILLLVPVFSSATFASAAIEELRARGVPNSSICVVCVSCTVEAAQGMALHQPDLGIITGALEKPPRESGESTDDFLQRYFASSVE